MLSEIPRPAPSRAWFNFAEQVEARAVGVSLVAILGCFLAGMLALSPHIFPVSGNWMLVEVQKLHRGATLYGTDYTVSPPVIYVITDVVYRLFGAALQNFRIAGSAMLTGVLFLQYLVLRKAVPAWWAVLAIALTIVIYVKTPWEIYYSYLYVAYGFLFAGLLIAQKRTPAAMIAFGLFVGVSWMSKITIGGMAAISTLGYFGFVLCLAAACRDWNNVRMTALRAVQFSAGVLTGYLVPFGALAVLGIKVSLVGSFALIYAGGTKGTLAAVLTRPFLNLGKYAQITLSGSYSDTSTVALFLQNVYHQVSLEVLCGIVFVLSTAVLIWAVIKAIRAKEFYARAVDREFLAAVIAGGVSYASAMSNIFDTDQFIITVVYAAFCSFALARQFRGDESRGSAVYPFGAILFGGAASIGLLVGIGHPKPGLLDFIVWADFLALLFFVLVRGIRPVFVLLAAVLLVATFWTKYNLVTFNWWESNLLAKTSTLQTALGFYAPPMYYQYAEFTYHVGDCFRSAAQSPSAYAFPTSTLPYHILNVLPATRSVVHHADVFSAKYVGEEFERISAARAALLFLTAWTPQKMNEIDRDFAGGKPSSQTLMWRRLMPFARRNYRLIKTFVPNLYAGDEYNFPIQVWLRKDVGAVVTSCIATVPTAHLSVPASYDPDAARVSTVVFGPVGGGPSAIFPSIANDAVQGLNLTVPRNASNGFRFYSDGAKLKQRVAALDSSGNWSIAARAFKPGGGFWAALSDERVKFSINPYTDGLLKARQLVPVWFTYNGLAGTPAGSSYVGLVAQSVRPVLPYTLRTQPMRLRAADARETQIFVFDSSSLNYVLLNSIVTLEAHDRALERRLEQLEH